MSAQDNVRLFVLVVVDAAIHDAREKVPTRAPQNTGSRLLGRLNLHRYRNSPRNGDSSEARRIYTAARFLYDTERCELKQTD
jgi:hypothetical protein